MSIALSIIVCTFNRQDILTYCLQALVEQTLDKNLYEILIVNNNSTDSTQEIAESYSEKYSNFRVVVEKEQGLSHARNCGWYKASGKYIAFIDDDAKAMPEWCERILNAFDTVIPTPAAVGGQIHPFYEIPPPEWFTDDFEIRTWGESAGYLEPPHARYGFSGSNMAFERRILEKFGGFSPQFGIVGGRLRMGEDTEFFNRIYDEEPNFWYDPSIKVLHLVPKRNLKVMYRITRGYNCGRATASMQGRTISILGFAKCVAGILLCLSKAAHNMPSSISGIKRKFIIFFEHLGYQLGLISVRK